MGNFLKFSFPKERTFLRKIKLFSGPFSQGQNCGLLCMWFTALSGHFWSIKSFTVEFLPRNLVDMSVKHISISRGEKSGLPNHFGAVMWFTNSKYGFRGF